MGISIDNNLSSMGNIYSDSASSTSELESTLSSDLTGATEDELMEVCKDFETYFVQQMFEAMQAMVPKDEDEESNSATDTLDMFQNQLIEEYATSVTENQELGIAQSLYEQMKRNYDL